MQCHQTQWTMDSCDTGVWDPTAPPRPPRTYSSICSARAWPRAMVMVECDGSAAPSMRRRAGTGGARRRWRRSWVAESTYQQPKKTYYLNEGGWAGYAWGGVQRSHFVFTPATCTLIDTKDSLASTCPRLSWRRSSSSSRGLSAWPTAGGCGHGRAGGDPVQPRRRSFWKVR